MRGIIKDLSFVSGIPETKTDPNLPPPLQLGLVMPTTQIVVEYESESESEKEKEKEKENQSESKQEDITVTTTESPNTKSLDMFVGGLKNAKAALTEIIQSSLFQYEQFSQFHIQPPHGVLLYFSPLQSYYWLDMVLLVQARHFSFGH